MDIYSFFPRPLYRTTQFVLGLDEPFGSFLKCLSLPPLDFNLLEGIMFTNL